MLAERALFATGFAAGRPLRCVGNSTLRTSLMIDRRVTQFLPIAAVALVCALLGGAWIVHPSLAPAGIMGRIAVVMVAVSLPLIAGAIAGMQAAKSAQSARRYIDGLCELELNALSEQAAEDAAVLRKEDRAWREVCERVRQRLVEFARRAEELGMARAAAEVRVRRIVAERDQLSEILAGLVDPVIAVDQFGEVVLTNPSAERLLDVKASGEDHPALEQLARCEQLVSLLGETRR